MLDSLSRGKITEALNRSTADFSSSALSGSWLRWRAERFLSRSASDRKGFSCAGWRLRFRFLRQTHDTRIRNFPAKWRFCPRCSRICSRKMERPVSPTNVPEAGKNIARAIIGLPPEGRERLSNGPCSTVSSPVVTWSMVRKSQFLYSWLIRFAREKPNGRLTRKIFNNRFGGATPANHGAVDGSIVAVISAHINPWAHAHRRFAGSSAPGYCCG